MSFSVNTNNARKRSYECISNSFPPSPPTDNLTDKLKIVVVHGDPSKPNTILPGGKWDEDDFESLSKAKEALNTLCDKYEFIYLCNHDTLMDDLRQLKKANSVDLVLQLCDDGWNNHPRMELHVVALLDMLQIPYTGSGPKCIGVTYDKQAVLKIAESIGIPVPKSVFIDDSTSVDNHGLMYPVLIKPNSTDGSFGITAKNVCYNKEQLIEALKQIREVFCISGPVLVQEFLEGRDVNVAVLGSEATVLPITEEDYSALPEGMPKICGFESKWDASSPYWNIKTRPTTLSPELQKFISTCSQKLFHRLEARDYARFDWRLDALGNPRLLEANPNCGWCWDGHLPKTAALAGISYPEFFRIVIDSAWQRHLKLADEHKAAKKFVNVGKIQS